VPGWEPEYAVAVRSEMASEGTMSEGDSQVTDTFVQSEAACIYDAGDTGCGEGLHMEFRRRLQTLEVGELIEVTMRDPSAKEDLPPLVRMMGHRIRSTEELGDGRMRLLVERSR
jgi:TusA-related sulfurtransferase